MTPTTKTPQKLPIVLSPEEVLQFLGCVRNIKHRTILTLCYAAGLRVSEAICLKVTDRPRKSGHIRNKPIVCRGRYRRLPIAGASNLRRTLVPIVGV
jgi:site-specific recombinase XerD